MRGLILKDLRIIKKQYRILLLAVLLMVIFVMNRSWAYVQMLLSYTVWMAGVLALNTVSYDNFNNGFAYLFTMPVTPAQYVAEKYILSLLLSGAGCVVSLLLAAAGLRADAPEGFMVSGVLTWMTMQCVISVWLFVTFKCGPEKGRVAFIVVIAVLMMAGASLTAGMMQFSGIVSNVVKVLDNMGPSLILILGVAVTAAVYGIFLWASVRVMQKKEF